MIIDALSYRPVNATDIPKINQLMRAGKAYWGYSEEGLDRFMKTFGIADATYFDKCLGFIAESKQKMVGFYLFKTNENPPMLDHFVLDTQQIGKGYGRRLWKHCVEQTQKQGWTEFTFWSDPHTQGFYEHMGAVKIDERPMVTLPGHVAPIMRFLVPSN